MADFKKHYTFILIGAWIIILLVILWVLWSEGVQHSLLIAISITGVLALAFHTHILMLNFLYAKKKYRSYFSSLFLLGIIVPVLFFLSFYSYYSFSQKIDAHLLPSIILTVIALFLSGIVYAIQNWFIRALKKKDIEQQKTNAELLYLKAQINPHFLFNTLNNIHGLAIKNSPQTPDVIVSLATQMRYMLYESNADFVPLEREISFLENYIGLQQIRYKAESILSMDILGDVKNHFVAPLLFIHLVENAFKHSPRALSSGDIRVFVDVSDEHIYFSIKNPRNPIQTKPPIESGGIGLSNVQTRLKLLYPNSLHSFKIDKTEDTFIVHLKIKNTKILSK